MFIRVGAAPLQSLADCDGKRILLEGGTYSAEALQALGFGSRIISMPREPAALLELANGKGDVAIVTQTVGQPFRERMALRTKITPSGPPVLLSEYALASRKGRPHLLESINEDLNRVRASGKYAEIYGRWLNPDQSATTVRIVLWALGMTLFISLLIMSWNRTLRRRVAAQTDALRKEFEEKERTQKALIEAERSLRRAQKMEAIGRLSGGIAHDFNNILTVIPNYGQFLREKFTEHRLPTTDIDQSISTSERAVRLTRQLLAFSRATPIERTPINLCSLVREMKPMLERLVGEHVQIVTSIAEPPVHVLAESTQIEQMLLNLSANARDAMSQGGRLTNQVASQVLAESNRSQLPPGSYAAIRVTDNGAGMDETTLSQISEPFFTTKELGKGTGLGLSTVFANMARLDGKVSVESIPGAGTTFHLFIPEVVAEPQPRGESSTTIPNRIQDTSLSPKMIRHCATLRVTHLSASAALYSTLLMAKRLNEFSKRTIRSASLSLPSLCPKRQVRAWLPRSGKAEQTCEFSMLPDMFKKARPSIFTTQAQAI
jgi:signal transduction histidine kinase